MSRFSETLLDHASAPRNQGAMAEADAVGTCDFNGQPPRVRFYLRMDQGRIVAARFEAHGCGVTVASCSMLTELAEGRTLAEAVQVDLETLIGALEGVPPDKRHSPSVALAAFQRAVADALNRQHPV